MATALERVRRVISDKPSFRRQTETATGASRYQLDFYPISDLEVTVNGTLQVLDTDYTLDANNGMIEFIVGHVPAANAQLMFTYYSIVWTDDEVTDYLDQYSNNINITAAHILLAWSGDAARLAKRETRSGGGGLGAYTVDTSVAARELRNTAKALMDWEQEYGAEAGTAVPADGLTEIPWTESAERDIEYQRFLRES